MNNDCCARQVCISSTDQWGIRWSTALSQPDSVVDSSSYLAIANLKYKINANISIQGPSPSATIDEAHGEGMLWLKQWSIGEGS